MSISNGVKQKILNFNEGQVFSFDDFKHSQNNNIVALVLSRLCKDKIISRISKGLYYRPKRGPDGVLPPSEDRIISSLNDGHVSGVMAFRKLGLTDVAPTEIVIMGERFNRKTVVAGTTIRYQKKKNNLKTRHVELLQILDALKEIKNIPGTTVDNSIEKLKLLITSLSIDKRLNLVSLGLRYNPMTRALVGAMLEELDPQASEVMKKSLNPKTHYKLGVALDALPNKKKWGII